MRGAGHEHGEEHDGYDRQQPGDNAIAILTGIELALERGCVALECPMDRVTLSQRLDLLEQKRRE